MQLVVPGHRLAAHGLALAAVTTLVLIGALTLPAPQATRAQQQPPDAAQADPAQRPLDLGATAGAEAAASAGPGTQGANQQVVQKAPLFNPSLGLPLWLRGVQDVALWSASDPGATLVETVPATAAWLKPLGPFGDTRVEVYFPGDDTHAAV